MSFWQIIKPKTGKEIPFLILVSFLITFICSRLITNLFPNIFLTVKGVHVHHFAYGFILLVLIGYINLTQPRSPSVRLRLSLIYGLALGLSFDEFAMWVQLENVYKDRSTYDAIVIVTLILLNIVYFEDFWRKRGRHLHKLIHQIFT